MEEEQGQGEQGDGYQFGCDLMQQKADKVISGTRRNPNPVEAVAVAS